MSIHNIAYLLYSLCSWFTTLFLHLCAELIRPVFPMPFVCGRDHNTHYRENRHTHTHTNTKHTQRRQMINQALSAAVVRALAGFNVKLI